MSGRPFERVGPPYWDEKPVAIVAGGPSLIGFDFLRLRPFHVLAVKATIFDLPWASAGFGLDMPRFLEWRAAGYFNKVRMPVYWAVPRDHPVLDAPREPCMNYVERLLGNAISHDADKIYGGGSSGFGALNFAILKRAKHITLFGFDYRIFDFDYRIDGQRHHNPKYYERVGKKGRLSWLSWAMQYAEIAPHLLLTGVDVMNASPNSLIGCFPRHSIDVAISQMEARLWTIRSS